MEPRLEGMGVDGSSVASLYSPPTKGRGGRNQQGPPAAPPVSEVADGTASCHFNRPGSLTRAPGGERCWAPLVIRLGDP